MKPMKSWDEHVNLWTISYSIHRFRSGHKWRTRYRCEKTVVYYSARYDKSITVRVGYWSDGATGVCDLSSFGWWVHDVICDCWRWDDGSQVTVLQSSMVLHDILDAEGRSKRANSWGSATYAWQLLKRPFRKAK